MAEVLRDWLKTEAPEDMEITVSVEPSPLGTGGAIKFAESWIRSDPFFVLNGDSLAPGLDFQTLEKEHLNGGQRTEDRGQRTEVGDQEAGGRSRYAIRSTQYDITLAIAQIEKTGRYGTVEFDEQNRVTAFLEKAERENGWINTGVYCISRRALEAIEPNKNISIETDIFPALALAGQLRVFRASPPLLDMGTPEGLAAMKAFLTRPGSTQAV